MSIKRGTHIPIRGQKPKVHEGVRECETKGCPTILSRYNGTSTCFQHRPLKYGRVRGRIFKP